MPSFTIKPMSPWTTYIVRCKDGGLYTGISTDVERRLETHNAGKGAAYTRSHRPVELVWSEQAKTESTARKREAEIKRWTRAEKEKFVCAIVGPSPNKNNSLFMAKGNNAQQKNKKKPKKAKK